MQNNVIYLESYVESTSGLPPELQRILTTIRSLDERSIEISESIRRLVDQVLSFPPQGGKSESAEYLEAKTKLEQEQAVLIQFADEKVQLAYQACDLLDLHALELDRVIDEFEVELAANGDRNPLEFADGFMPIDTPAGGSKKPRYDAWDAPGLDPAPPPVRKGNIAQKNRRAEEPKASSGSRKATSGGAAGGAGPSGALPAQHSTALLDEVEVNPVEAEALTHLLPPGMKKSSSAPQVPGKILTAAELNMNVVGNLTGRMAELYWPDDESWYVIQIQDVDTQSMNSQIMYVTGETEQLDLREIAREGHMSLIDPSYLGDV